MEYSIQLNAVNNPEKSVRAFATLVFGDSFKVTNVAVLEGSKGNFVSMPSFRTKERDEHNNPVYKDVCNPITKEFREELYNDILKLYEEMEQTGKAEVKKPGSPFDTLSEFRSPGVLGDIRESHCVQSRHLCLLVQAQQRCALFFCTHNLIDVY